MRAAIASLASVRSSESRRAVLAGLSASLVGIGMARFAYTPLIPVLIAAGWFSPGNAAYLGAANLVGYLAGALLARRLAARAAPALVLRGMMLLASAAFFACALPLAFVWFALWRFAAGFAGGALMVLAAPAILPLIRPHRHGFASGAIFTGVGLGIMASGTLVPLLLRAGLVAAWCGLGALALLMTLLAWRAWPDIPPFVAHAAPPAAPPAPPSAAARRSSGPALRALHAGYALNAVGLVPAMVFLVDYIARGLDRGLAAGAWNWVLYGIGATAGPLLAGRLADAIGFACALRLGYLVQAAAVALLAVATAPGWLALASLVLGAFTPGIVPLVLGRARQLAAAAGQDGRTAWSIATTAFAVGQAAAAYGFSALFARAGYALLFELGAAALLLALAIDLVVALLAFGE